MTDWDLHEPDGWTDAVAAFGQRVSDQGRTVTLTGTCKRCTHDMSVELAIEDRTGQKVTDATDDQDLDNRYFYKLAYCNCVAEHKERPADQAGCGAYGLLRIG